MSHQENVRGEMSITQLLKKVGVNSVGDLKSMLQTTKWSVFAETYFQAPPDLDGSREMGDNDKLILDEWQKKILDKVQNSWYNRGKPGVKQYILIVAPRGYGKSVIMAVLNSILLVVGANTTAIFAPSESQSETIIAKTKYFIGSSQFRKKVLPRGETAPGMQKIFTGSLSIGMKNGSFSVANSNNEKTIRGGHFGAVLIDEYARMSMHTVKAGIFPMVRRSLGPVVAITTPFGRFGPAWEAFENRDKDGVLGKGPWLVIQVDPFESSFMTKERLEENKLVYGDDEELIKQELMAEFVSDDNAVFKDPWFAKLHQLEYKNFNPPNRKYDYNMALDFGWDSNRAVMKIGHFVNKDEYGDTYIQVDLIKSWLSPDPQELQDEIVRYCKNYRVKLIVPDGQSVGVETLKRLKIRLRQEGLASKIYKSDKSGNKLGFITTGGSSVHSKTNLVAEGTERLSRHEVRLPSHTQKNKQESYELEKEMKAFAYKRSEKGASVIFGRGVTEEPDDRVLCLLYLLFSFTQKKKGKSALGAASRRDHPGHVKGKYLGSVNGSKIQSFQDIRSGKALRRSLTKKRNFGRF